MSSRQTAFLTQLIDYLGGHAPLTALVGTRIWQVQSQQAGDLPYIAYSVVSGSEETAHDGPTGMENYRIQFDLVAADPKTCSDIRDALKTRLNGVSRTTTFGTGSVKVGSCFYDTEQDFYDEAPSFYRKTIDFLFTLNS